VTLYENLIAMDLIFPTNGTTLKTLDEIIEANYTYTFVYLSNELPPENEWVSKKYANSTKGRVEGLNFCCTTYLLLDYLENYPGSEKFALYDRFVDQQFILDRLNAFFGHKYRCHAFQLQESVFHPLPHMNIYEGPVGNYLKSVHERLNSVGQQVAIQKRMNMRKDTVVTQIRRDMKAYDPDWLVQENLKKGHLFQGVISLMQLVGVFKAMGLVYIISIFTVRSLSKGFKTNLSLSHSGGPLAT